METADLFAAAALGLAGGFVGGLLGVGGGILFVPALAIFVGQTQLEAESTSLIAIAGVAVLGTWRQQGYGNVRLGDGLTIGALSFVGVAVGVVVANSVSQRALELGFAALLLDRRRPARDPRPARTPRWMTRCRWRPESRSRSPRSSSGRAAPRGRAASTPTSPPRGSRPSSTSTASAALTDAQRDLLRRRLGSRVSAVAQDARGQARNRELALERLRDKLAEGLHELPERRPTRPDPRLARAPPGGQAARLANEAPAAPTVARRVVPAWTPRARARARP